MRTLVKASIAVFLLAAPVLAHATGPDLPISTLPAASSVSGSDQIAISQGGTTKSATVSQLPSGGGGSGGGGTNAAPTVLTFSSTVASDFTTPNGCITNGIRKFRLTATGNFTLSNPSNVLNDGQQGIWEIIQDGTGSRIITMDTQFAFGSDITGIVLSTAAGKRDFITAYWNATASKWYVTGFTRGY